MLCHADVMMNDGTRKEPGLPPSGFTQRATINSELGEIYMLSVSKYHLLTRCEIIDTNGRYFQLLKGCFETSLNALHKGPF